MTSYATKVENHCSESATRTGSGNQQHGYLRWIVSKESCNIFSHYMHTFLQGDFAIPPTKRWSLFFTLGIWAGLVLTSGLWQNDIVGLLSLGLKRLCYIFSRSLGVLRLPHKEARAALLEGEWPPREAQLTAATTM